MKRNKAKAINSSNARVITDINSSRGKVKDAANNLLGHGEMNLENIKELASIIATEKGYKKNQLVVCDIIELNQNLSQKDVLAYNPIFVILHDKTNFVTFCIVQLNDCIICLYKDFYDTQVLEGVKNILKQCFCTNIVYKVHPAKEFIENNKDIGTLALKTLETMMVNLKPDKSMDFIHNFASPSGSYFGWLKEKIENLKNELFVKFKDVYYNTVATDIDQLSRDIQFKKAVTKLIDSIPSVEEVDNVKNYQALLKQFVEIEINEKHINEEEMKELQAKLEQVRKIVFNKTRQINIETSQNEKGDTELDIVQKFPKQMGQFTNIFKPLLNAEIDDHLHKILKDISEKLELDYNKVISFFKVKEGTKPDVSIEVDIEDIMLNLPALETKESEDTTKPLKQLLSEIEMEQSDINVELLKKDYEKVKSFHHTWCVSGAKEVNQWAIYRKGRLAYSDVLEAIAIMDRANEIATGGHRLRDTQILSILVILQQKDKGLLSQIETGEGKTTIVSVLAALFALQGCKVDVITSNPILASDVVKDKHIFYRLLNLTASTNNLDENYKSGARQCYSADVVYGSINNFQFDYLKDSFLGLNTRGGRAFDKIILDEVDSMIIDNASHIAKLSNPMPGMDSLKYVYVNIWQALYKAEARVVQELKEELNTKVQDTSYESFLNELQNSLLQRIKGYIRSSNPTKVDIISSHLQEYAEKSLDKWIDCAINARYVYEKDVQYIIGDKNGEKVIQPVDYSNTGITLKNTIWQYGLHQFLQLKHNVHLTSESLTSCFISNLGYINKYGGNIFGVTGTLGSEAERALLSSIYNVGYLKIPTFKQKKFKENDGEVVDDEILYEKVAYDVITTISEGRSALIICETIKQAKAIQETLNKKQKDVTIRTFFNEDNAHITEKRIDIGEAIIATNIAGRGTDLKTSSKLDSNGGLQVFVTFLPCNKRVEDQAFGRTARQGNNGTAKLIIKKDDVAKLGIDTEDFEEIKRMRDMKERERIKHIKEVKVSEIVFQDELFKLFAVLYRQLKNKCEDEGDYQFVLDDLKEFWAFWLEKNDFQGSKIVGKCPEGEFEAFKTEAHDIITGKIKFNPYHSILQAEHFISKDELAKAEIALKSAIAISKNPEILYSAYMKLFDIAIEKGAMFMDKCKKAIGDIFPIPMPEPDREYKRNAKTYLEQAIKALKKELNYIEHILSDKEFINIINSDSDGSYWFSDEDMDTVGKSCLSPLVQDINTQFVNRLTEDQIDTFCKERQLKYSVPIFICYNVGGKTNENSGHHWIGMCILKTKEGVALFYKDSKGDLGNNFEIVRSEFQKHYKELNVIAHSGSEQTDDSSCGPMTLENLRIMANFVKEHGTELFVASFTKLDFSQQKDAERLRNELKSHNMKENILIKHIISRQLALNLNVSHAESLVEQIGQHKCGISLGCRIPDYFSNLKPENEHETKIKDMIENAELAELARVGGNITYSLRAVQDVCPEIVANARTQIIGGITLFASGCCFPPALPVTSALSGTMITEGICDVAFELINMNCEEKFNRAAYVKGKVISYGVTLLTMGIKAALQCPKILNAAKKACRWLSRALRRCPYLKKVCEHLATKFDKIHDWFERLETVAKYSQMSKAEKLQYFQDLERTKDVKKLNYLGGYLNELQALQNEYLLTGRLTESTHFGNCISSFQQVTHSASHGVAQRIIENVIMNKVVTPGLSSLMSRFKPEIEKQVEESVRKNIDKEKLRYSSLKEIQKVIKDMKESIDLSTIRDIFKDAILGITKHCNDWRVQLVSLAVDQYYCWEKLYNYVEGLCKSINSKLKSSGVAENENMEELINYLVKQLSDEVYALFLSSVAKTGRDVYSVGRSAYQNYKKQKQEEAKCFEIDEGFRKGGPASQEHARALSDAIKRPIHIYEENGNIVKLGEQYLGDPIKLKYFPPDENNTTGHYVPYDSGDSWPSDTDNDCLFRSVASQLGKDPEELKDMTRKHVERDPTRYIAHHLRDLSELDVFLEGGRRKCKPIHRDYYPSHLDRIQVIPSKKCEQIFRQMAERLDECKTQEERYSGKKEGEKLRQVRINKNVPQFTSQEDKEEVMMGIMVVNFTNGKRLKLMTVSGDDPFSTTSSVSFDNEFSKMTKESKPSTFRIHDKEYKFVNVGKPKGNVWDVYNKCQTKIAYNRSCSAQKLFYFLGEQMKNTDLEIKGKIQMSECYYVPHKDKYRHNLVIEESCPSCKLILPVATGKDQDN
ncbi:unnamed protein product [Callosobruchus maculatus]|uniref:Uncharacterized protein n=1 Tax=Callosobruchus maculatus TaxID=64391 RepID=A0A653BIH0_CALMS|nr:unnamed protein product [Callosobruchus maculatus]